MTLTPLDIHNKEFSRGFRGYNEAEVDEFLDQVVKEFEALLRENSELKDRLDELERTLERYRTIEDSLNKTLLLAQKAAEEVRQNGEKEAELIRERALMEAQRIVDEARSRARQAVEDYTEMRREAELFRLRMKTMLQAQLEIFEEDALRKAEAADTPFAVGPKAEAIAGRYREAETPDKTGEEVEEVEAEADEVEEQVEGSRPSLWGEPISGLPGAPRPRGPVDRRLPPGTVGLGPGSGSRVGQAEDEGKDRW